MTKQLSILMYGALLALAGCASVKPSAPPPLPAPTRSVAEAQGKLALAARERARAEAEFAVSEQQCYSKFLVNNCLDNAREKRRTALAALRAIENEAERYQRQAKVDERDRAIAKAEQEFKEQEAKIAAQPPAPPYQPPPDVPPKPPAKVDRAADHAAKMKRIAAEQQAGAAKRAANVAALEKRKAESAKRQREVEEKKQQKAAEAKP
jgi:colicin import membrane protein